MRPANHRGIAGAGADGSAFEHPWARDVGASQLFASAIPIDTSLNCPPRSSSPLSSTLSTLSASSKCRQPVSTCAFSAQILIKKPEADSLGCRFSAGQHSASVSSTASTTSPPSLPPTSCARTNKSTSARSRSSTRPVQSTKERLLPRRRSPVVVCPTFSVTILPVSDDFS